MGAKAKVFCGVILFFIVFGLRFFCATCQRYPPQQQQQLQMQTYQQQLQAVTIPIQKDLLSNENRLQSQVLRTGASLVVQDASGSADGQKEYYTNWSARDNTQPDLQQISQPQLRPGKNCKRKRRPQVQASTTALPSPIPQQQYWPGRVEDEQLSFHQKPQPSEASPTQISERLHEPSTTKFSERIGEAYPSRSLETIQGPTPTHQGLEGNRELHPLEYSEPLRRPLPTIYSEKIREFNPTMESLIARHPITSTVFDKIREPSPTKISERNREFFSTKSSGKVPQEITPSRAYERIRDHMPRREQLPNRNSEKIREPLAALEKEQKLFELRQEFVVDATAGHRDKSYRRPYSQAKKESTQQPYSSREEPESKSLSPRSPIDLKKILKNSGGMSLSEILQQKNLSLDDLLKGKQNALLALQTTAIAPQKSEENTSRERFSKPIRRIPLMGSTTTTTSTTTTSTTTTTEDPTISDSSVDENSFQSNESQELLSADATSKESEETKLSKNAKTVRKNLKFPSRIRMSPTTRRQQHLDTTIQQKFSTTTTTFKPTTTRVSLYKKRKHTRPSFMRNPSFKMPDSTSASESAESKESREPVDSQEDSSTLNYPKRTRSRPSSTTTTESINDQTDPASNLVEDSGENEILLQAAGVENNSFANENKSVIPTSDQQKIDAKNQEEPTTDHIYRYNSLKNYIDNNLPHAVFMDIDLADIDPVDDRTDLLELIEDRRSGNRLIKILEQRNMTLEQLIEHRKRGSSQLHLATFVQNRSGVFPGKKVVMNDDMDIVTAFENFPHFNLLNLKSVKPDEIKTDSEGSSYFTSIIDIEPTDEAYKDGSGSGASPKNSIRNPSSNNIQRQPFYPSWKSLALASLTTTENARKFLQRSDPEPPQQTAQRHQSTVIEEGPILQIEDEVARAHDLVDLELSGHGFKRSAMNLMHTPQMPAGIRSAIVASAAIVLTSLVTFMVIFVACRWKQRRRRHKLDYIQTYNAMKSKIPVISSRKTDELATSMTSLGVESAPSRNSRSSSRQSQHHQISIIIPGSASRYPSTTSLSAPSSKLNTMDPSSPEVQDYLFDALRKSF